MVAGVHNYEASHLKEALELLEQTHDKYPYEALVSDAFSLQDAEKAFQLALTKQFHRVAMAYKWKYN